jgi:hypothetical protein
MNMQLKSTSNNNNPQHLELQHPSKVQAIGNFLNCSIQVKLLPAAPCSIQVKLKLENIGHASQFKRKFVMQGGREKKTWKSEIILERK